MLKDYKPKNPPPTEYSREGWLLSRRGGFIHNNGNIIVNGLTPKPTPPPIFNEVLSLKNFKACFSTPALPRGDL